MPPEDVREAKIGLIYVVCAALSFGVTFDVSARLHVRWSWTGAIVPYLVLYAASLVLTFSRGTLRSVAYCMVGLALGCCLCLAYVDRSREGLYIIGLAIFAAWYLVAGALEPLRHHK
jgi:hypothetical protein